MLAGLLFLSAGAALPGLLKPIATPTRELQSVDGIWSFLTDPKAMGFRDRWFTKPLAAWGTTIEMPVPASYNDITQDKNLRDYVGWVWYERQDVYIPQGMRDKAVYLYFGGVHYNCTVYVNGEFAVSHEGGHMAFQADISKYATSKNRAPIRITVAVDNTLTSNTIPPGSVSVNSAGVKVQHPAFDFFNYAGIDRPVTIHSKPTAHIDDITVDPTTFDSTQGQLKYSGLAVSGGASGQVVVLTLRDKDGNVVATAKDTGAGSGVLVVKNPTLWWPVFMSTTVAYRYTLELELMDNAANVIDFYLLQVGFRNFKVTSTQFLVNGKPFIFQGLAKHEDSAIRGKGFDWSLLVKDFNLLHWFGANSFRTSHYPYADEIMDACDRLGVVVIDECQAVGLRSKDNYNNVTLALHLNFMEELIRRDKNRPAVAVWSVANEPDSTLQPSDAHFKKVISSVKAWDPTRPVTVVVDANFNNDLTYKYSDFVAINRYYGWYSNTGETEVITQSMIDNIISWHNVSNKPVMVTEYGADTVAGLHRSPATPFTEDFQTEFMTQYFHAFDLGYAKGYFIGEMVWNFADFMTDRGITRIVGNKKGVLTRDREPKQAAYALKARYEAMNAKALLCPATSEETDRLGCQQQSSAQELLDAKLMNLATSGHLSRAELAILQQKTKQEL